jgi:hypothetical protein
VLLFQEVSCSRNLLYDLGPNYHNIKKGELNIKRIIRRMTLLDGSKQVGVWRFGDAKVASWLKNQGHIFFKSKEPYTLKNNNNE